MTTWTLAIDESGRFEAPWATGEGREPVARIVGGLLAAGSADEISGKILPLLRDICRDLGVSYPPHATELARQPEQLKKLRAAAASIGQSLDAWWFFLLEPPHTTDEPLSLYTVLVGELVEMAARVCSRLGGSSLELVATERYLPLTQEAGEELRRLAITHKTDRGGFYAPLLASADLKQALSALGRQPSGGLGGWPGLGRVLLQASTTTARPNLHPTHVLADVGCHALWTAIRKGQHQHLGDLLSQLEGVIPERVFLLSRPALAELRRLDQALRDRPPSLVQGARELAALQQQVRAERKELGWIAGLREGVGKAALWFWENGAHVLAHRAEPHELVAMARGLADEASFHLNARTGDYEGVHLALDTGWHGGGPLAKAIRKEPCETLLRVRLGRLGIECANHRGDTDLAHRLAQELKRDLGLPGSLALLLEQLEVETLLNVVWQNELPCSPALVQDQLGYLKLAEEDLSLVLQQMDRALATLPGSIAQTTPPFASSPEEERLSTLAETEPRWRSPDPLLGKAYGTAARSAAFLGRLDTALVQAMLARSFFADSPADLRFNACVLARISLEAHRRGLPAESPLRRVLAPALQLSGVSELSSAVTGGASLAGLITRQPGQRFQLDILVRTLLWAPETATQLGLVAAFWREHCRTKAMQDSVRGLRTHPSELLARHIGELLQSAALKGDAGVWYGIAIDLGKQAPAGSTLARLLPFTELLSRGGTGVGPLNTLENPTFEYR